MRIGLLRISTLLSLLVLLVFINGCSLNIQSPVDLIKRPKIEVDQQAVRNVIDANLPTGAKLIRPLESNNLSSVGIFDWDGNGRDDFYAFYRHAENLEVGVIILTQTNNNWHVVAVLKELGTDISFADIRDFNRDGYMDILLGVSAKDDSFNGITAFEFTEERHYKPIFKEVYTELRIEDVTNDGQMDILLFKLDRNKFASAHLFEFQNNQFTLTSEVDMDAFISGYYAITYGKVSIDHYGFMLDFTIGSKSASNILYYDKGSLKLALDAFNNEDAYKLTIKDNPITSRDVDGDGILELGNRLLPGNYYEWSKNPPYLNMWYQWDGSESLNLIVMNYIDEIENFRLDFPHYWIDSALSGELILIKSQRFMDRRFLDVYLRPEDAVLYKLLSIEIIPKQSYDIAIEEKPLQMKIGETEDKLYLGSILDLSIVPEKHLDLCRSMYLDSASLALYFSIQ